MVIVFLIEMVVGTPTEIVIGTLIQMMIGFPPKDGEIAL